MNAKTIITIVIVGTLLANFGLLYKVHDKLSDILFVAKRQEQTKGIE